MAGAALVLPIVYLGGFGLWLVAFSFATAAIFRFTQQVTQRGLSNAAWSAFYNVAPERAPGAGPRVQRRRPGPGRDDPVGAAAARGGQRCCRATRSSGSAASTAILCIAVVVGIRRRYPASLIRTLRAGLGEQVLEGGPGLAAMTDDPLVCDALIEALEAPEPAVRRMAAGLLGRTTVERAGPALVRAVDDDR